MKPSSEGCDLEILQDWFDGRLDPAGAARVQSHLAGCPACREAVAGWEAMRRLLSGARVAGRSAARPGGWAQVAGRIASRRPVAETWLQVGSVAAAITITFALWQILSRPAGGLVNTWDVLTLQSATARQEWVVYHVPLPQDQLTRGTVKESEQ
jgi:anti-sigma factor RsiW